LGDLIVRPAYQFGPRDIITVDKLNLIASPVVELSLTDPVNDQNFFRNGNFYSSFWTNPAGVSCPDDVWTTNASYWLCRPQGGAVNFLRSSTVPDLYSLFSAEIQGALNVAAVEFGQQINGDISATMRRNVTFSGYIYNASGLVLSPALQFYTADVFNNFSSITFQTAINLQSGPNLSWTYVTATTDLSLLPNVANGLMLAVYLPAGTLNDPSKYVLFSRLKIQLGEVATEFVDDPSLFIQAPSVDSTMLQDGCIARPALFMPSVIPAGTYMPKSIKNGDIDDGAIDGRVLAPTVSTTLTAGFTQPAVGATVSIAVVSTAGFIANQPINIAVGGAYTIASVTDASHLVVTNTGAIGNAAPTVNVPTGGVVTFLSVVIQSLGYTPINKAGDSGIGPGPLNFVNDDVVGAGSVAGAAAVIASTSANAANDGYMPALSFSRPGIKGRAIGLSTTGRFRTVDDAGAAGYLLDSVFQVATTDVQDKAITLAKLADEVINLIIPSGMISAFAGPSPPSGWFVCDGTAVSRTTYAALFAAIGTYWGSGDNVSTFNLPDLRGRTPIGFVNVGAPGITARAFATLGGEETHVLSVAEMASHAHAFDHFHSYIGVNAGSSWGGGSGWGPVAANSGSPSAGMQAAGGNVAHNTMQPFSVVYYIVKI
jgi:microcystin-dependent protein